MAKTLASKISDLGTPAATVKSVEVSAVELSTDSKAAQINLYVGEDGAIHAQVRFKITGTVQQLGPSLPFVFRDLKLTDEELAMDTPSLFVALHERAKAEWVAA